jgi:hypothetical protein
MRFLSQKPSRPLIVFLVLLLAVPLATHLAAAQSSPPSQKTPPPPPAPPAAADQEQFISYWTTETGWRTELQLRNNQVGQVLTVTPVLRSADGTETALFPVTVQPQEIKAIDVATAIGSSAPQLIGTYGSLSLRYHTPGQATLYAVSMVMSFGHSIAFHIDATGEDQTQDIGSREGIWWLPNGTANDYLVLTNHGQNPIRLALSLFDASGKASIQNLTLPPRGTNRVSVRQLVAAAGLAGSYGGIKVSVTTNAGSLNTLHVLFDPKEGFSAVMKMFYYDPRTEMKERDYAKTGQWTLRAPMLALSNPDPALAFPVGTILQPQLFVRNTTPKPINTSLTFNWRSDSASGKSPGPALRLNPYETRRIDVAALQDGKTLPQNAQWTSVTLATTGQPDEVMAVAASYDQALKYGAQTPFSDQLSHHWAGGQWQYDPYHSSIITAGNGGSKPTQAAFTIFYNQGAQKYQLEQTLQPGEQMWIDVGKLIRQNVPDKNGKTLPKDLTSGSYEFRDLTNTGIGTLFEGKVIYDKTYGHVTYGCATCCGYNAAELFFNPLVIPLPGPPGDSGVWGYSVCDQQYEDVSSNFNYNWSTADTNVVTVDCCGVHTPRAVGGTTSSTSGSLESTAHYPICPAKNFLPNGGDTVQPVITSYSPNWGQVGTSVPVSINGTGFGSSPTVVFLGTGITATYSTQSDTSIAASFTIASSAPVGFQSFVVQNNRGLDNTIPQSAPVSFQVTPATAVPVNFRTAAVNKNPSSYPIGTLEFVYYWDSSTGNIADLANCSVGEIVYYPVQSPDPTHYRWTQPPYTQPVPQTTNPFLSSAPATNILNAPYNHAGAVDDHYYAGFQTPYAPDNFTVNQYYRFQCSNYQSGAWTNMVGPISIQRTVTHNANGTWRYDIYKSGQTNSVNPMP